MGASLSARGPMWTSLAAILAILLVTVHQLGQPPEGLKPKVFVLGLSKTGTTSIGDALERLGYRRLGWRDIRSRHSCHTWANGDLSALEDLTRYYDAFEDLPWPMVYREMAERFPSSKFVLSLRKDEETWLRSMDKHMGRGEWMPYAQFFGATKFQGNEETIRQSYRNHTQRVREYFQDKPERYMEMIIDDGDINWDVLCRVAQCPGGNVPTISFPKSNPASAWDMGLLQKSISFCRGWTITRMEEILAKYYYERDLKEVKALLRTLWKCYDFVERASTELEFKIVAWFSPPLTTSSDRHIS